MELPQHHSDVLVVGGGLSGLLTAALLARRGLRVMVIGHNEIEGHYTLGPALLPETPFLVADFETPSALHSVVEELGLRQDVRRQLPFAAPALQLIDESHRLDLYDDDDERAKDLCREFGEQGTPLAARLKIGAERLGEVSGWLDAAPGLCDDGFFVRRKLAKYLASSPLSSALSPYQLEVPALERWLQALVPFATHVTATKSSSSLAVRAAGRLLLGTRAAAGGERALLAKLALSYCSSHGGKVLADAMVTQLDLTQRKQVVVDIAGNRSARAAHFVVDASRGSWLADKIISPRAQRAYEKNRGQIVVNAGIVSRHILLKAEAIPEGIAAKVIVSATNGEDYFVNVDKKPPSAGDKHDVDGLGTLSLSTVCQPGDEAEAQRKLKELWLELMPFSELHVVAERAETSPGRMLYANADERDPGELGPMRAVTTEHSRLLRVGSDILPAWGLEGEFRSALVAADHITAKLVGRKTHLDAVTATKRH